MGITLLGEIKTGYNRNLAKKAGSVLKWSFVLHTLYLNQKQVANSPFFPTKV
jgi:hypothetical protein